MDAEGPRNVSIHAPTQGATIAPPRVAIAAVAFQSTHPRRVRLEGFPLLYAIEGVSIHAPTQGATISRSYSVLNLLFQSTHPRRVRHFLGWFPNRSRSFNPRTHAGCDACWAAGRYACIGFQSTHPRRVRPARRVGRIAANRVSIHAPTQGATPPSGRSSGSGMSFQSTHPRRVRRYGAEIASLKADVSIHAPTQGATRVVQSPFFASPSFNPRTHAGCDVARRGGLGDSHGFNPRTHAGCDVTIKHIREPKQCFNPRTHAGCDGFYGP